MHDIESIKSFIEQINISESNTEFGNEILRNTLFIQLMIFLNRIFLKMKIWNQQKMFFMMKLLRKY